MPKGITIQVKGLKELQKKLGGLAKAVEQAVDAELHEGANDFINLAVAAVPVDQGLLRHGLSVKRNGLMDYEGISAAFYSAYIEWGTKSKVQVPSDLESYAAQFRGKGKAGHQFFEQILAWVHRTGITARYSIKTRQKLNSTKADKEREYQAARAIYYSILKHGIKPQPFFFGHREKVYKELQKNIPLAVQKVLVK